MAFRQQEDEDSLILEQTMRQIFQAYSTDSLLDSNKIVALATDCGLLDEDLSVKQLQHIFAACGTPGPNVKGIVLDLNSFKSLLK
jgi:hypothetical protein